MYTFLQCADVEATDIILIKDEDDMRGCGAGEGETLRFWDMAWLVACFLSIILIIVCCAVTMMILCPLC